MEECSSALRPLGQGVWERIFKALITDRRNEYLMLDTTLVRAHQQAATGKGGQNQALGRS
jgi:hypothetical protein